MTTKTIRMTKTNTSKFMMDLAGQGRSDLPIRRAGQSRSSFWLVLFGLLPVLFLACIVPAFADAKAEAEAFFNKYVALGNNFDIALGDLYSDNAQILNTRIYPNGQQKTMTISVPNYRTMLVRVMPLAKAKGDKDSYSQITYKPVADKMRIQALRHNHMKNYDSWLVLVIAKQGPDWKIVQELSQSRP